MEAKEGEAKADASLLSEVARYFKDQAFMCSKDEGLEVVFDDFVAQHSGAFADDALARTEGHSFEFTELHEEYLRLFEKATERVLEVCGGTRERFARVPRRVPRGVPDDERRAPPRPGARPRARSRARRWFLDAAMAALEYGRSTTDGPRGSGGGSARAPAGGQA
ncbi:hypothetical protein JL722_616 [Aureococcus anophagefferens]|nr:hypothetical protein JL722_616 [Aureococcus anophagefferens]